MCASSASATRPTQPFAPMSKPISRAPNSTGIMRAPGYCADMPAAYLAAAVAVAPSTTPEAFGRIAIEAQAMGAPVIVSDLGAAVETVLAPPQVDAADATGWRAPAGDAAALARAIREALELRPSAREGLTTRARLHAQSAFFGRAHVRRDARRL